MFECSSVISYETGVSSSAAQPTKTRISLAHSPTKIVHQTVRSFGSSAVGVNSWEPDSLVLWQAGSSVSMVMHSKLLANIQRKALNLYWGFVCHLNPCRDICNFLCVLGMYANVGHWCVDRGQSRNQHGKGCATCNDIERKLRMCKCPAALPLVPHAFKCGWL